MSFSGLGARLPHASARGRSTAPTTRTRRRRRTAGRSSQARHPAHAHAGSQLRARPRRGAAGRRPGRTLRRAGGLRLGLPGERDDQRFGPHRAAAGPGAQGDVDRGRLEATRLPGHGQAVGAPEPEGALRAAPPQAHEGDAEGHADRGQLEADRQAGRVADARGRAGAHREPGDEALGGLRAPVPAARGAEPVGRAGAQAGAEVGARQALRGGLRAHDGDENAEGAGAEGAAGGAQEARARPPRGRAAGGCGGNRPRARCARQS